MISFIGYYNYTVILTYISLFCSIAGMLFTVNGWYKMAVLCLALSGLCDMFDGKIARRKTDRTDDEKCFGIQIDSLCDICSGTSCGYVCRRYAVCDEYPGEKTQEFHTGSPSRRCCPGNLKNLSYFLVFNNDDQKPKCITEYCR